MKSKRLQPLPSLFIEPPSDLEDAQRLSQQAEAAIAAFFHEGTSRNTARTYRTALQYWGAWHALRYGSALAAPVSPAVVNQFIVDHLEHLPGLPAPEVSPYSSTAETTQHLLPLAIDRVLVQRGYKTQLGPWSMATVQTRLAALSKAHEQYIAGNAHLHMGPEKNPLRDPRVRQLISAARRAYARRGRAPVAPVAATREIMEALLASCEDDLIGKRDRALLLFGWASGGRRRSEIIAATFENVRRDGQGYVYDLRRSKTNQNGRKDPRNLKPIQGAAAEALALWMQALLEFRITHGPLFRRILNDRILGPLKDAAVREIVRRRARMASEPLGKLSAHSLRSGFVTEAGKQGISLGETMAMTGHRSVQTVMGYYQSGELSSSRAARLLDTREVPKPKAR
jgi:integrase